MSQAVVLVLDWAIAGPFRDPASNLIATPVVAAGFRLPRLLPPSSLSSASPPGRRAALCLDGF
ncbi:MAG: hypothetical protein MZV70_35710 [Desulfobacterales bacterium]|nr:hypothetical protein [Desulfobacterales bacterium]